jgi:3-oxoacyl-[acyl-carrier protein] reductase
MAAARESNGRELEGKTALVTGGARNIGRAISLSLAAAGANVAVNTRASRDEADAVVKQIRDAGGNAETYIVDIADPAAVREMADAAIKRYGCIDILVLNASVRRDVRFVDMDFEEWRRIMSLTLDGSFHCIKACLSSMRAAGGGNIIMLGGDSALTGAATKVHSSAAKSGLIGMTRALARDLAEYGIRANCVSPGHINTTRPAHRAARPEAHGLIPLGRFGEADEVAAMVRFLCGPGGAYITGQTIHVNGGQTMF